mmetsp:Transcript_9768/g.13359  ORF Transcript_9768/g.13359 Transcript_9768/m.13359 type:complete len:130 (-) Transcript_9768:182-571(-)
MQFFDDCCSIQSQIPFPSECNMLEDAHTFITTCVDSFATETVLYATSQYAIIPDYDGFYKAADRTIRTVAIQVNLKQRISRSCAYLIPGNVPEQVHLKDKWTNLSEDYTRSLLGVSLEPLYPQSWSEQP